MIVLVQRGSRDSRARSGVVVWFEGGGVVTHPLQIVAIDRTVAESGVIDVLLLRVTAFRQAKAETLSSRASREGRLTSNRQAPK